MESKRQQKVASLLQQELAAVFQRDLPHLFTGLGPGINTVRVSPDLGIARVYLNLLLAGDEEAILEKVRDNSKMIRMALAKRIRRQLRIVPDLSFFFDNSAAYASHMDKILNDLDIPPAPDSPADDTATGPARPRLFADDDNERTGE